MSLNMQGRRILITGASSGIGAATAVLLASQGAHVVGAARRIERIPTSEAITPVELDVTDSASVKAAILATDKALGGLDVLINAAGVARFGPIATTAYTDWQAMFAVNTLGLLAVTQAAIPSLREGDHPQIINVSSMSGHRVATPGAAVYAGTKFAVQAISEGLRKELAPDRIRVSTVSPSYVKDTEIHQSHADPAVRRAAETASDATGIEVSDCAELVAYIVGTSADVQIQQIRVTSDNPPST